MLKIRIIPCLDVADGRVVKGVNFVNLKDAGDPVEAAYRYDQAGADEICFLDINATYKNRNTTYDMVRKTAEKCFIPLTVGGGVRTVEDVRKLLLAGADKVSFNSAAVANPEIITAAANQFGSQCIVCAIDAKTVDSQKWELFTHGGRQETGIDAIGFAKKIADMLNTYYYHTSYSDDLNGVEVSAAIKNIFSMAVGAAKGLCSQNISPEVREKN